MTVFVRFVRVLDMAPQRDRQFPSFRCSCIFALTRAKPGHRAQNQWYRAERELSIEYFTYLFALKSTESLTIPRTRVEMLNKVTKAC